MVPLPLFAVLHSRFLASAFSNRSLPTSLVKPHANDCKAEGGPVCRIAAIGRQGPDTSGQTIESREPGMSQTPLITCAGKSKRPRAQSTYGARTRRSSEKYGHVSI